MNNRLLLSSLIAASITLSGAAFAQAKTEINWVKPEDFTDIRPANESRKRFRERVMKQLEDYMTETLAAHLPEGYHWSMTITDLDLAGQVWPGHFVGLDTSSDVRMIKRIDIPRMDFDYQLKDAEGKVVMEEQGVELKDMSFQDRVNPLFDSDNFKYEKNMLRRWFNKTFAEHLKDDVRTR
ncbi:hypothetical protein HMF8227_02858 [Saliniradius amylolyticus]|uniref:DUF3016 domain-containing protein n=1 Tax=Saliniradius amylolyticus TaxID=2183582 RepID=A0A2S2E8Q0_9ALTE|nr:DUF3016 domain-containing protein [Saliniradius amylolyticus]AWL13307.1 hypothetical protein HMF8227_02858 [Saliniradius amylolyticus]